MKVEFYRHALGEEEKRAVLAVLDSLFLTTGDEVYAFEREFADFLGVPYASGVSSCTAALHLALVAHGVGPGDEVITTPLTFVATVTSIFHAGATPVLVDVDPETGNIDPEQVARAVTPRTKAISAVHLYGTLCDMPALRAIADEHDIVLIEDAAHCVEGERDGYGPAQVGDVACFSFYATKNMTSGEGGALAFRNAELADRFRVLRLHGMDKSAAERYQGPYRHWDQTELGYKYNLTNIQAAMLRPQLGKLGERLELREAIACRYDALVDANPHLERPRVPDGARSARHLYTVWTEEDRRDEILATLGTKGVGAAVNFRAVHQLDWMRKHLDVRHPLDHAERIGDRTISLPFYHQLTRPELDYVCEVLEDATRP